MVVYKHRPTEPLTSAMEVTAVEGGEIREVVGNGKRVRLARNSGLLKVIGNSNLVTVTRNDGRILVVGNRGKLQIAHNTGYVGYTGNEGVVEVGATSEGIGQVVYTGNGGKVLRVKPDAMNKQPPVKRNSKKATGNKPRKAKEEPLSGLTINGIDINPGVKIKTSSCFCGREATSSRKTTTRVNAKGINNVHLRMPGIDLGNWGLNFATELLVM